MTVRSLPALAFALALAGAPAWAHEGHDHGEPPPLPTVYEPRFEAHAGDIELTGILRGDTLWLYASHYASNAPWPGLRIEVEQGEKSALAQPAGDGVYRLPAGPLGQTGTHAVVLGAQGEGLDELLTGELVVTEAADTTGTRRLPWGWIVAGGGALAIGAGLFARRRC